MQYQQQKKKTKTLNPAARCFNISKTRLFRMVTKRNVDP